MNNKLWYIFVLLVLGTFVFSGCNIIEQDAVGRKITKEKNIAGDSSELTGYGDDRRVAEVLVPAQPANVTYNLTLTKNPYNSEIRGFWFVKAIGYFSLYVEGRSSSIIISRQTVTISATPYRSSNYSNYTFSDWSGDIPGNINRSHRNFTFVMDRNRNIVANFRRI